MKSEGSTGSLEMVPLDDLSTGGDRDDWRS